MNVTLYAICKNEEKNVERFIENSKKFSHTVVVDTGSTDKTVQLLRDAGITVHEHPQTREEFDFSIARNQALSYVETEWAFSLDFNEDIDDYIPDGFSLVASEFTSFKHQRYDTVTEVSQVLNKQIRSLHTEKLTPESEKIKLESEEKTVLSDTAHIRFHRTKNYTWINSVHETPLFVSTEEYPEEISVETTIKITKRIFNTVDKELFYLSICERENKKDPSNSYYIWFIFKHYYEVKNYNKALEFGMEYLSVSKPYVDPTRINVFIMCSEILILFKDIKSAANYSFHALSESMKLGGDFMNAAFERLIQIGKITQNPNITIFATGFNPQTLSLPERTDAIDKLFLTNLDDIPSTSWGGHRRFAEWILRQMNPNVTVDLGVDYGLSTFSFAIPRIGHVYGIDNFIGDEFVGYDQNRMKYDFVMMKREKLHLQNNLTFIEGDFDTVAKTWDKKIDILHIDGSHVYEDVKKDFETWTKFLSEDSVVLLHDTNIEEANGHEYGVKKFFDELDMPKFNFLHSFGLGVVSKNPDIIRLIGETFSN